MTIRRAGDGIAAAPTGMASGSFLVQTILASQAEGEMTAMRVYLDPGVVSHWHRHPRGQMLFVLDGVGLVQNDGGAVAEVRAGDSVWFGPNERHWHGASPVSPFSYVSVQAVGDGAAVRWMEPVHGAQPSA
ncbi:MAG: cupin domain-containing protein [Methylobacterium sp.]